MKTPTEARNSAVCPLCGETYNRPPALSRVDGETLICPDCGIREALSTIGVPLKEQEEILTIIHSHINGMGGTDDAT